MTVSKYLIINSRGIVTLREREPSGLKGNEICLRIRLDIPEAIFKRPMLDARMTIPDNAVPKTVITPEITDNIEKIIKDATGLNLHVTVIEHKEEEENV